MLSVEFPNAIWLKPDICLRQIAPVAVDKQSVAQSELAEYLTQQAQAITPELGLFSEVTHTIRQLKAEVSKLHKEMGAVVTKAAFGRRASDMTKSLLVKALNFVQGVLDKAPRTYRWTEVQESRRISTSRADGKIWCTFFGFVNEYDANRFYYWLFKKPGRCTMAVVRRAKSTDCPFEVKVWGVDPEVLARAIRKDTPMEDLQDRLKAEGAELRQDIPGHFTVWTQAGKIGTVEQRFDVEQNSWWVNQRQMTKLNTVPGDGVHYATAESAALALVQLCWIIVEGERTKLDLFGA